MAIFLENWRTFLLPLLTFSVLHAQDESGFISIDCGLPDSANSYNNIQTGLRYVSDLGFVDSGTSKAISAQSRAAYRLERQFQYLRSFPEGDRNCYEIGVDKGRKYLIRAGFLYGNYDSQNQGPMFDLHIGSRQWDTVNTVNYSSIITREIIHMTTTNFLYICLVNTGRGTPFISTLELRPLRNISYVYSTEFGSLARWLRLDLGSSTGQLVRFRDDAYDRFWSPYHQPEWKDVNTTEDLRGLNDYLLPSVVMKTAATASNPDEPMTLSIDMRNAFARVLVCLHFAEIVKLKANKSRIFNITINGQPWFGPVTLDYLNFYSLCSSSPLVGGRQDISLVKVQNSTLPPLMNAVEVFYVVDLSQSTSNQDDVDAIKNVKRSFGLKRDWQGDPCSQEFLWDGLDCSYIENDEPRIVSLNLSSAGLTGEIPPSISRLTSLQYLDLSNNSLTGSFPHFLSELPLKVLNLATNKLTGSVPASLIEKSDQKSIQLSVGGNPDLCISKSCESKKSLAVPIVSSITGAIILVIALAALSYMLRGKPKQGLTSNPEPKRRFTHSEVVSMTNNFEKVLGKGGFGTVYLGYLESTQVAVKMLSPSSADGYKQFQAEVQILLRVHHRNLTSLVGFCDEGTNMGLIYEYMANGDIEHLLSGPKRNTFGWERRLQVVVDAAQGLEYLHNGCRPAIVHRDIKPANILLNEKLQAKLADFGLSRSFPVEGGTHISTSAVAGTLGYLDPEYYATHRLTEKSDVYSFGVFLLKIITGRPVIETKNGTNTHICRWVKPLLDIGDIKNVADPSLGGDFGVNSVWRAVEIAMDCTSSTSEDRPNMLQVVTELNQCLADEIARKKQTNSKGMANMVIWISTLTTPANFLRVINVFTTYISLSMLHASLHLFDSIYINTLC